MKEGDKMSVVKSKRGQGKLLVYTRANELAVYTIQICANEKHFPKRYRWCITNKIVECAVTINNCVAAEQSHPRTPEAKKAGTSQQTRNPHQNRC